MESNCTPRDYLKEQCDKQADQIQKLQAALDEALVENCKLIGQVRDLNYQIGCLYMETKDLAHDRDQYKHLSERLLSLPDCNTCGRRDCYYRPRVGAQTRLNCADWAPISSTNKMKIVGSGEGTAGKVVIEKEGGDEDAV